MWFGIVSLLPEMFQSLDVGITGRALRDQKMQLAHWNPRDFTSDKHKTVDAKPYGGGPGMVMMAEPLQAALQAAKAAAPQSPRTIYLSPQGRKFDQAGALELSKNKSIIFLCGRYEGVDERLIQQEIDEEWSIGDYILTGGELAAMVMIDAIARFLPDVVGDPDSVTQDSLSAGLLKYAQYTRPEALDDEMVPEILLSGHHKNIEAWRLKDSLGKTWLKRPDLLQKRGLSPQETSLLCDFIRDFFQQKPQKNLEKP